MQRAIEEKDDEMENARIGYQVAVDLWTFQSTLNWSRFNAMLTANSIILAIFGVSLQAGNSVVSNIRFFQTVLLSVGLFLCLFWIVLTARGNDYHRYWIKEARDIEIKYFRHQFSTISGAQINDPKGKRIQFGWLSRSILGRSQNYSIYFVISAFIFLYVASFIMLYTSAQAPLPNLTPLP